MSKYNQEFNTDHVILRYIMVATLAELRNKIYFYNQVDEDTKTKIDIPFLPSITGNERLLNDLFKYLAEDEGKALGDYEVVPRGIVKASGLSIDSGGLTDKFVRSEFVREYEGQLKSFSLETMYIPIIMSFDVNIICSNNLEMLKATESIISKLYKATFFQVDLGMMRIEASVEVPEDYAQNRLFEWGFSDKKEFEVEFPIEVKSFMPVFEDGILLSEIIEMTKNTSGNPDNEGIGMFRDGEIRFGGVIQQANYNIDEMNKSPGNAIFSNLTVPPASDAPLFLEAEVNTAPKDEESEESKKFRGDDGEDDRNS